MYSFLRDKIAYLYSTFHGSESILLARFNMALGSIFVVAQGFDVTQLDIDKKYVMAWVVGNGVLTEYLRRRNAEYGDDGSIK